MQALEDYWGHEPDYAERVACLQEFIGYTLYRSNRFEAFAWMYGPGGNGKGVILDVMEGLVGKENVSHAALERLSRAATRASLEGKLLNVSTELSAGATLADGYLKAITSGDTIDVEPKYRNPYSVTLNVKLVSSTNHLPKLWDTTDAFVRRAIIFTFSRQFEGEDKDVLLRQKLAGEQPGILRWAVAGLQRLIKRGHFVPPPSSVELVSGYRDESDPVRLFFKERLVFDEQHGTKTNDLYEAFRAWASDTGFSRVPDRPRFGRVLTMLKVKVLRKSCGVPIRGVRLVTPGEGRLPSSAGNVVPLERKPRQTRLEDEFDDQGRG